MIQYWSRINKEKANNKITSNFYTMRQEIWTLHQEGFMNGEYEHEKELDIISYQRKAN